MSLRSATGLCCVAGLIMALGCRGSAPASRAPAEVLADANASVEAQARAVEALASTMDAPEAGEALRALVWKRSLDGRVRIGAVDALVGLDPEGAGPTLALVLPTEADWAVIDRICDLSVERGWTRMTPALVRSWSREVARPSDADRPERAALLALHPGRSEVEIAFRVFASEGEEGLFTERERAEAWALVTRLVGRDRSELAAMLAGTPVTESRPDVAALKRAAESLGSAPATAEQLEQVTLLFGGAHGAFIRAASEAIAGLTASQRAGLEIRHAPIIAWAVRHRAEWVALDRAALLALLESRLARRAHFTRNVGPSGSASSMERLRDWEDDLAWGDALSILVADEILTRADIAGALFEQADADTLDKSTEHGGAIVAEWLDEDSAGDALRAAPYLPRASQRVRDTEFIASSDLLRNAPDALLHYHFHAQRVRNREYAGPSDGDLRYAERFGRACLVLTFVERDELAVDYYQPGGARVDLGVIRRP